jgi:general secretion pathway protein G
VLQRVETAFANRRAGFTLIELIVVIAIIASLATIVGPLVFRNVGDAKTTAAKGQIEILSTALQQYRVDNGAFPTSAQGLEALRTIPTSGEVPTNWRGPYLSKNIPLDPWGKPYVYASPGVANATTFDLYSFGKDGRAGGVGEDADITSWDGSVSQ